MKERTDNRARRAQLKMKRTVSTRIPIVESTRTGSGASRFKRGSPPSVGPVGPILTGAKQTPKLNYSLITPQLIQRVTVSTPIVRPISYHRIEQENCQFTIT